MDQMYVAACSLDDEIIRLVIIATPVAEEAQKLLDELVETHPRVKKRLFPIAGDIAAATNQRAGTAVDWWRGDLIKL